MRRVAHFQWSESPREPWRGVAPLAAASKLGTLAARVEGKLSPKTWPRLLRTSCLSLRTVEARSSTRSGAISRRRKARPCSWRALAAGWEETRGQTGTRERLESATARTPRSRRARETWKDVLMAVGELLRNTGGLLDPGADGYRSERSLGAGSWRAVQPIADLMAEVAGEALDVDSLRRVRRYSARSGYHRPGDRHGEAWYRAGMSLADAQRLMVGLTVQTLNRGSPYPSGGRRRRSWAILWPCFWARPPALLSWGSGALVPGRESWLCGCFGCFVRWRDW